MSAALATRMVGADVLKLRKRRGTLAWALVLAVASQVIFFVVGALQHSSDPLHNGPVGGVDGLRHGLDLLCFFVGPLAAVLIGTEAGVGDGAAGVYRDLVVTGRSRLALFASRIPAALAITLPVVTLGFGAMCAGVFLFAGSNPLPDAETLAWSYLFALLANGLLCIVAVGLSALLDSKAATITAFVGWQLVLSPVLIGISSLGSVREALLDAPLLSIDPAKAGHLEVPMSLAAVLVTLVLWPVLAALAGAWRARTMDA
jgi:ABC-type transport system involved in multi-copper enzyme maturation permease subunit